MTSPRRRSQKSTSMSGSDTRSGLRKRSKMRSKSIGSTSVIRMDQATSDPAAAPRPDRNPPLARVADEVPDDQEVALVPHLPDHRDLVVEARLVLHDRMPQA